MKATPLLLGLGIAAVLGYAAASRSTPAAPARSQVWAIGLSGPVSLLDMKVTLADVLKGLGIDPSTVIDSQVVRGGGKPGVSVDSVLNLAFAPGAKLHIPVPSTTAKIGSQMMVIAYVQQLPAGAPIHAVDPSEPSEPGALK